MGCKAEALARTREARLQANNLRRNINNLYYDLRKLGGYDGECVLMTDAVKAVSGIVKDLFELEGRLSHIE